MYYPLVENPNKYFKGEGLTEMELVEKFTSEMPEVLKMFIEILNIKSCIAQLYYIMARVK